MRLLVIERKDRVRWISDDGEIQEEPTRTSQDASEPPDGGDGETDTIAAGDEEQSKEEEDANWKSKRLLAALKKMAFSPRTFTVCLLSALIGFMSGKAYPDTEDS